MMEFKKIISRRVLSSKERIDFNKVLFLLLLNKQEAMQEISTLVEIDEIKRLIIRYKAQAQSLLDYLDIAQNRINIIAAYYDEAHSDIKLNDDYKIDPSGRKLLNAKSRKTSCMFEKGL